MEIYLIFATQIHAKMDSNVNRILDKQNLFATRFHPHLQTVLVKFMSNALHFVRIFAAKLCLRWLNASRSTPTYMYLVSFAIQGAVAPKIASCQMVAIVLQKGSATKVQHLTLAIGTLAVMMVRATKMEKATSANALEMLLGHSTAVLPALVMLTRVQTKDCVYL